MLSSRTAGSDRVTFVYVPGWSTLGAFAAFLRDCGATQDRDGLSLRQPSLMNTGEGCPP
jgi:hypothetical protein